MNLLSAGSKPAAQLAGATRKKPLILEVPAYNKSDSEAQRKNIRTFYQTLLENYTDYALEDVAKKVWHFVLILNKNFTCFLFSRYP